MKKCIEEINVIYPLSTFAIAVSHVINIVKWLVYYDVCTDIYFRHYLCLQDSTIDVIPSLLSWVLYCDYINIEYHLFTYIFILFYYTR